MLSAVSPSLAWAHPLVQEWLTARFSTPTEPQEQGWTRILAGHATLVSAPTGSGKTLAAFLACIDRLVSKALAGELRDRTEVLYVSPPKALGNDIQKNLEIPLGEILQMAGASSMDFPESNSRYPLRSNPCAPTAICRRMQTPSASPSPPQTR